MGWLGLDVLELESCLECQNLQRDVEKKFSGVATQHCLVPPCC